MNNRRTVFISMTVLMLSAVACKGDDEAKGISDEVRQVTGLTSCQVKQEGYYYLGIEWDFSGPVAFIGTDSERAVAQALGEINAAGGVNGRNVGYVACDNQFEFLKELAVLHELAGSTPVSVTMGFADHFLEKLGQQVTEDNLPHLDVWGWTAGKFAFSTVPIEYFIGTQSFASMLTQNMRSVVEINLSRNASFLQPARDWFVAQGGEVTPLGIEWTAYGWVGLTTREAIDSAAASQPQVVYLNNLPPDVSVPLVLAGKANTVLKDAKWYYDYSTGTPAFVAAVGDNSLVQGMQGLLIGGRAAPRHAFDQQFQELWDAPPSFLAYFAYDAAYLAVIAMALASNPDDRTEVRDRLHKTHGGPVVQPGKWANVLANLAAGEVNYEGITGPMDFGEDNMVHEGWLYLSEIDANGKFVDKNECWSTAGVKVSCD